jgi:hypothetical protein
MYYHAIQIRASSQRREAFAVVQAETTNTKLELLRDLDIRWSSTLLMIDRALFLRDASVLFAYSHDLMSSLVP